MIFGIGWVDEIAVGAKNLVHMLDRMKDFGFERFMVVQVGVVERGHAKEGKGEGDGGIFLIQKIHDEFGGSNRSHGSRTPDGHQGKTFQENTASFASRPYN